MANVAGMFVRDSFFGVTTDAGMLDPIIAISSLTPATFLIVGLAGVELRDHQKFSFPFLFGAALFMAIVAPFLGVFPL